MVALTVRYLGQKPVSCGARPLLFSAHDSLERRQLAAAGCQLREAMRLFLVAECEYWDCLPPREALERPAKLAKALGVAGQMRGASAEWIGHVLGVAKNLIRCRLVPVAAVENALHMAHAILDGSPYLIEVRAEGRRV